MNLRREKINESKIFSKEDIKNWLDENKSNIEYWTKSDKIDDRAKQHWKWETHKHNDANWKDNIHAAKLLQDLFTHFIGRDFHKTKHSVVLTKIILKQNPENFKEFVDKISKIIK